MTLKTLTKRNGEAPGVHHLNNLLSVLKVGIFVAATSMLVNAQAPGSVSLNNKGIEVEIKTDKVQYII